MNPRLYLKKLHFFDYLIVLVLILGLLILYRFFNPEERWVYVEVMDDNVPVYQAISIKPTDFEVNPSGKRTAEIEEVRVLDLAAKAID